MQTLTIKAVSLESAQGFLDGLAGFPAQLREDEPGVYTVEVTMGSTNQEIVQVLNALENYVTHRGEGPAEVGILGRSYKLHPTDPSPAPA